MTAAPPRTADGRELRVETQPSLPGLGGLYARGAAASGLIAAGRALPSIPGIGEARGSETRADASDGDLTLPDVAYRVGGVRTDDLERHLHDYQRLVHEPVGNTMPAGYLHVLTFPLTTGIMVRNDFPLPLLGMVHLANRVELRGPVTVGDVLEVRAWAENLRPHRRGVQVDLVAEVRRDAGDETEPPVWRGVSTHLAKGYFLEDGDGASEADRPRGEWTPPLPTGRWVLGPETGRAYAAVSGDRNPIHMSALSAKAFGFPRAIAHGMYSAARALADVGPGRGDAYRWTVEFAKPVLLPATVDVAITPEDGDGGGFAYVGWNARKGLRHFSGEIVPL
ncbi:MaoC/PaaZ C-terminal domain-containing protein [Isoptericola sp. 178]|uniref:MaoC family dehydratase n=1 Tax=Isoptericola sp. 178 TaxID=3064651 RepID=UPI002713812E|nr:MaoC/PaaZ C-terminal domain-containing protein [Isoptericola sp. 178]MDO8143444.1 MaoC/PaaZ C-terminal domain-containing protein [Isoptericola sp. 178]